MREKDDLPLQDIGQRGKLKLLYWRKGGSTRAEGGGRAQLGHVSAAAAAGCRNLALHRTLRKLETIGRVRKGVSRVTLTDDSLSAHPAREAAGVKATSWWWAGRWARCRSYCDVWGKRTFPGPIFVTFTPWPLPILHHATPPPANA